MKSITSEFAEILGLLCAEGSYVLSYSSYWGKDRGRNRFYKNDKSERIEFTNKDKKLLEHYISLLKKEFNYNSKSTKHNKSNICKISIIKQILRQTNLGNEKWRVPKSISNSDDKIKVSFLRGYFDGDGSASGTIRFSSVNKIGLKQVSKLLSDLGFIHNLHSPSFREGRKPIYTIQLSRMERERFLKMIKPFSKQPGDAGVAV